ncbi:ABC transporter ATP-binding protein [Evansella cellulosilytica]|uniref:ABC transporter related protein n=1 Tax=Evansella cellulosilytica (strain ATCC 21833 / DSM 2522 / FERM P-1141 / JCM 9156 / N-4) TaxID=649639 RepID=E6U235_EVAC2|nr:ABC transporter ATP-binding protein [Evansella cellulosilytica]ADU29279.1 ABC transporter related protein [Evansella cellulosilytica DSM 2522]
MSHIQLHQLCKTYDQSTFAVEDATVSIEKGEFFILVGPSGCGKSTILRMIAGLEGISAGELYIDNQRANHLLPSQRNLSMVFQNYALYPHLTVEENILFGLKVKKVKKLERKKRCEEAAKLLGLTNYLKRKPRELSGGQRQRVALARAVVSDAPMCLMDEPLSNLDAKLRGHMRTEIRQLQRKLGITMIYVTHDQVEAMTMGDRIMVLKDGKVQQVGTPLEIYNKPKNLFVATFIGAPPMNISKATVDRMNSQLLLKNDLIIPISNEEVRQIKSDTVYIGIRPEQISRGKGESRDVDFSVQLSNVEVLGNETLLSFYIGEDIWKAKWLGQWPLDLNRQTNISFSIEKLYLFDGDTEKTVISPAWNETVLKEVLSVESR